MTVEPIYSGLPFSWQGKSIETIKNDCQWLESLVKNAAPFTDWWVKARIVQLAYPTPPLIPAGSMGGIDREPTAAALLATNGIPTYGGKESEAEIVQALRDLCPNLDEYSCFAAEVDENYVIKTLNSWHGREFTQAISRNFEVYEDRHHPNIFLVTSTATVSLYVNRELPPIARFRPLFNVNELGQIIKSRSCLQMTLRTHGYATPANTFYNLFTAEADALNLAERDLNYSCLDRKHFYLGYHWPSEQPFLSPGLWSDFSRNWGVLVKFVFLIGGFAGILGTLLYLFLKLLGIPLLELLGFIPIVGQVWEWTNFSTTAEVAVKWYWIVPAMFMLWLGLMQHLRILVYQRDRYRAIHYGAPDLSEFFWRLDKALNVRTETDLPQQTAIASVARASELSESEESLTPSSRHSIGVNLVGHSMGGLVLVNVLRILSDRFGKDDRQIENTSAASKIGESLVLDKLILASPDIPLEFLREGRNNYVRSAMSRCRQIYLMSSDRDIVLRYMPTLGNWFSEPSIEMSGYRLGNVYLKPTAETQARDGCEDTLPYCPYIRNMLFSHPAVSPTSAYDLFQRFNYIDCSEMRGVNGLSWPLTPYTGLLIDIINTVQFIVSVSGSPVFGTLDLHGGYFLTHTTSFEILKLLMTTPSVSHETIEAGIENLIADTPIRFLPSQPFVTK